jgi:ribA/ribD-fused uncharacterized protein
MVEVIDSFDGEYAFLSNFYPWDGRTKSYVSDVPVMFDGVSFRTVEHAFQALKTIDEDQRAWVRAAPTPGQAKRRGRQVTLRPEWDNLRLDFMEGLVARKFSDPKLGALLVATHPHTLVEGNNWNDEFWGATWHLIGPDERTMNDLWNEREADARYLTGQNWLGRILMKVRSELV